MLIRLTGQDAVSYITSEVSDFNAQAFEITNTDSKKVLDYFNEQFGSSDKIPSVGKYAGDNRARVVDTYSLLSNNCTTKSCAGVNHGGGYNIGKSQTKDPVNPGMMRYDKIISPSGLQNNLNSEANRGRQNVLNVTNSIKKEYNIINNE